MPFILALLGIIGAAYFWAQRASNARNVVGDVADMANDVRLAARRFGFSRKMNAAIARLSRKLYKIGGAEQMEPLMDILKASVTSLSDRQREALEDITRAMRVR